MERTLNELKDCDKVKEDMVNLRVLLGEQTGTYNKTISMYKDSLTEVKQYYREAVAGIEDLNDSIAVQYALLHHKDRKYAKLRRSRRIWSIVAIGAISGLVAVHLHWKNGPSW